MAPSESRKVANPSAWLLEKAQIAAKASGVGPEAVARILQKTKEQVEKNSEEHQKEIRLLGEKMTELRAKHDLNPFKDVEQAGASIAVAVQPKVIIPATMSIKRKLPTQGMKTEYSRAEKAKMQKTQPAKEDVPKKAKEDVPKKAKEDVPKKAKEDVPKKAKEDVPKKTKEDVPKKAKEDADKRVGSRMRQLEREDAEKQARQQKGKREKEEIWKKAKEKAEKRAGKVRELRKKKTAPKDEPPNSVFAESSIAGASRERTAATVTATATSANKPGIMDVVPSNNVFASENRTDRYPVRTPLPAWYTSINMKSYALEAMSKKRPPELTALEALKACIKQCEDTKSAVQLDKLYDALRDHVHKAEIRLPVTITLIRKANMLSPDYGLPRIFKQGTDFPWDLKADAYQLYNRWWKCDLNQDILRGIVPSKTDNRTSDRLDDSYRNKFPTTAKYYGEGDLVLGQWWPTQLCTVRDGAHGSPQGGIYGEKECGAYSIVLSGGHAYHDVDNGDVIEYSGTPGKNSTPTENTGHLLQSAVLGNPIRVIRSAQLSKKNVYRPELGLRYDGLYRVRGHEMVDQETAMYRFRLERCEGQDPIRFEGKAKRPTFYEVREYERLRDKGIGVW